MLKYLVVILISQQCETLDEPLLCSWLQSSVKANLDLDSYFEAPSGKCVLGSDQEFNEPLLHEEDLEQL